MFLSLRDWRAVSAAQAASRAELKGRIARILALGDEDSVTVNEITCFDPGCPGTETVILLLRAGRPTRALKIAATMADVTDDEIRAAAARLEADPAA